MANAVKIITFVPIEQADRVRAAMAAAGIGRIGDYGGCSFSVRGIGRFTPCSGANPAIGNVGLPEEVEEERIEAQCSMDLLDAAVAAIRVAHPYEEPVIEVLPMLHTD